MKRLYIKMRVSVLFLGLVLTASLSNYAIAEIPDEDQFNKPIFNRAINEDEKTDNLNAAVDSKPVEELQKPSDTKPAEEDTLLKELPDINDNSQVIVSNQIIGDDNLIEEELKRIMAEFGEGDDEMPQIFLDEVKRYIRVFQINPQYRKFITASLKRSARILPLVQTVFSKRGIPADMSYIAFIESGFNPRALSHAGALGMWQFMPATARNYSLRVSRGIDERLDPLKSTYAAVDYFHDLIAIFGPKSFLLAMAAYNSGEWKIISCLKQIDDPFEERNFWHIRPCLSKETREYPPKIIASAIIGNNPEAFGFPKFEMNTDEATNIAVLADYESDNNRAVAAAYKITSTKGAEKITLKKYSKKKYQEKELNIKPILYSVKKGDKMPFIAEAFGISLCDIKKWNRLRNDKLFAGQQLKIYPKNPIEQVRYTVKRGDTITEISESFHVRPNHIVICNGLKNGWNISTGQTLLFYKAVEKKPIIYVVKKGTNLKLISDKFDVKVKYIMMWNNLSSTTLYPGQKLKIHKNSVHDV